uniref:hypothetical protein n=1 Tax=unclassified Variovorax TaxID=663243 RepID=UPI000D3BB39F
MTSDGTSSPFSHIDDETLVKLAHEWRAHAQRGEKEAFGPAHALEVEVRRRSRQAAAPVDTPAPEPVVERPWWKFWA